MAFLNDRCARVLLTPKVIAACAPFSCGNKDLDEYYRKNGFDFMFSTEEQEREYRSISGDGPLHTRLMFFDLMQIVHS